MASKEGDVIAALRRLKESPVSAHNQSLIVRWDKKLIGNLVGFARRKKFVDVLRWWALKLGKDFEFAIETELRQAYEELKAADFAVATKNRYISMLRQFYKYLEGEDDFFPAKVRKLRQLPYHQELISEHGETGICIFKVADIEAMIAAARTPRDKAIIAVTYDSAGRKDEVWSLLRKHVQHTPPFIRVFLHGDKTKKSSRVGQRWNPTYFAVPYLEGYLRTKPFKDGSEDGPFWVTAKGTQMGETAFKTVFYRAMKNANVTRRRIQDLRHTKYTHLIRLGMKEGAAKKFMGWSINSKQPARYAHLTYEDTVEEIARLNGIPYVRRDHDEIPVPVRCLKCGTVNVSQADYCSHCNTPLSAKAIVNAESRERYIRKKYETELRETRDNLQKQSEAIRKLQEKVFKDEAEKRKAAAGSYKKI